MCTDHQTVATMVKEAISPVKTTPKIAPTVTVVDKNELKTTLSELNKREEKVVREMNVLMWIPQHYNLVTV